MSKTRRSKRGRYARTWWNHFSPLFYLSVGILLLAFIWVFSQRHEEQELLSPCEGGCSFFMVRAMEETFVATEAGQAEVSPFTIEGYIKEVFKENGDLMIEIAKCESGLNPETIGDKHLMGWLDGEYLGDSIGVFQIRSGNAPGTYDKSAWNRARANGMSVVEFREKLTDPVYNIEYAKQIFDRQGVGAWWNCYQKVK